MKRIGSSMCWHKLTLKVIDVLALLGHRCVGTHQLIHSLQLEGIVNLDEIFDFRLRSIFEGLF
jgi:hypothetical protein